MPPELTLPHDDVCAAYERPFVGRLFAYIATPAKDPMAFQLSIVVEGETGHYPLPSRFAYGDEADMRKLEERLNHERLKLSWITVISLLAQSLRRPSVDEPLPRSPRRTYGRTGG